MSVTLFYADRLICGKCDRTSRRTVGAGDFVATREGWRCPRCLTPDDLYVELVTPSSTSDGWN